MTRSEPAIEQIGASKANICYRTRLSDAFACDGVALDLPQPMGILVKFRSIPRGNDMKVIFAVAALSYCMTSANVHAQATCSATNDNKTTTCSVTCAVGERALCSKGIGSSPPSCVCQKATANGATIRDFNAIPLPVSSK